jgi:hypothetical protein
MREFAQSVHQVTEFVDGLFHVDEQNVFYKIFRQAGVNGILDALLAREDNNSILVLLLLVPTTCFDVGIGSQIMQDNPRQLAQPRCKIVEAKWIIYLLEALNYGSEDFPLKDA